LELPAKYQIVTGNTLGIAPIIKERILLMKYRLG